MPERTEAEARAACAAAGRDPDFVGTKGYPNWQDHGGVDAETRAANAAAAEAATRTALLADVPESPFDFGPETLSARGREILAGASDQIRTRSVPGATTIDPARYVTSAGNGKDDEHAR